MAVFDFHIFVQSLLYFFLFFSGLIVSITTGVNRNKFKGDCILFATFTVSSTDKNSVVMHSSDVANCEFPVYFGVFGMTLYGLGMGIYNMYAVCKSRRDQTIGSQMWVMPFLLLNILLTIVTIIVAFIVSVGYAIFCHNYLEKKTVFDKCSQGQNRDWISLNNKSTFNPGYYVTFMSIAMFGSWSGVLFQLIQVTLGLLRFRRNRKLRGMAPQRLQEETPATNPTTERKNSELEPKA